MANLGGKYKLAEELIKNPEKQKKFIKELHEVFSSGISKRTVEDYDKCINELDETFPKLQRVISNDAVVALLVMNSKKLLRKTKPDEIPEDTLTQAFDVVVANTPGVKWDGAVGSVVSLQLIGFDGPEIIEDEAKREKYVTDLLPKIESLREVISCMKGICYKYEWRRTGDRIIRKKF